MVDLPDESKGTRIPDLQPQCEVFLLQKDKPPAVVVREQESLSKECLK